MSTMPTLPAHLEADLENEYKKLLVTKTHHPVRGVDNMSGYPVPGTMQGTTWSASEPDPQDPQAHLEHDDAVSDVTDELGRRIMAPPTLFNPNGAPNLEPDLGEAESRPVSPLGPMHKEKPVLDDTGEGIPLSDRATSDAGESTLSEVHHRVDDFATDAAKTVPGPLKIDQAAREKFRQRLREALKIVSDDTKPLTLGSLTTLVDEITNLDTRLSLIERTVRADRHSTRYIIETAAKSEAAASETRMKAEVTNLRRQIDIWRLQVPEAPNRLADMRNDQKLSAVQSTLPVRSRKGFRRG